MIKPINRHFLHHDCNILIGLMGCWNISLISGPCRHCDRFLISHLPLKLKNVNKLQWFEKNYVVDFENLIQQPIVFLGNALPVENLFRVISPKRANMSEFEIEISLCWRPNAEVLSRFLIYFCWVEYISNNFKTSLAFNYVKSCLILLNLTSTIWQGGFEI